VKIKKFKLMGIGKRQRGRGQGEKREFYDSPSSLLGIRIK